MLRVGNTGDEILQILDVIAADIESEKTMNEIAEILFWSCYRGGHKNPLSLIPYIKDYIKKCIKKHICDVYLFPQCVWKSMINLWKSVEF